ncbi:hypothetical protein [Paucisalibacillus globulus]|nr:hypothetical protein [Paucisalibacillus globulus]
MFKIFTGKPDAVEMKLSNFFMDDSLIKSIYMSSRADGTIVVLVHYGY